MEHSLKLFLLKIAFTACFSILTLLTVVTMFICYPYRVFVLALSKILRPDLADLITKFGNVTFAFGTPTVPTANICICLTLDGEITVEQVRKRFQKNILDVNHPDGSGSKPYGKLQQTITTFMNYGFYRWVKDFNLNEHIRPYDYKGPLALPMGEGVTEKDLERIAGKLVSRPYAPGKSHWEFLVVQNYTPERNGDKKTLIVLRMSHAIADGYSIQGLLSRISDNPNLIRKFQPAQNKAKFLKKLRTMMLLPVRMLWDAGSLAVDVISYECNWKIQRKEGDTGENIAVFTKAVHIDVIKTIKNTYGVSYTSVLLTALSSSIHRAMSESGQKIPNKMYLMLPVPKPNHPGGLTNHVSAIILPLPIVPNASPSSIAQVDAQFKKCIRSTTALWTEFTLEMVANLPLSLVKCACSMRQPSAAASIFPVDSHKQAMEGKLLCDTITFVGSLAYPATNGITISMGGSNSFQRISICMDRRAFPNEQVSKRLPRYIEDEIDNMLGSSKSHNESNLYTLDHCKKGV